MQEHIICPYPGLRPFNEDESIFFKGRDEHIEQIVKQLEEKKFLMLTGASGDGKSSLVYAGLIPNARAGFFKAKFNNWVVADFRPEREPLANMAISINQQLKINDLQKVERELSYGFSSLIDLYKSSAFWVDQNSEAFLGLNADEQKKIKRKGANLLILVDQFEEFFTNPENYIHGKTSLASQTVVNVLLETARLAIEQDIPIYIICTMRSDYIGQCASFRGLPEYIGYSQFFVPRLKRKEIYQVIEEPALLNANKISKRLVEMLINEMNDGIDQLPVLQHALNQIWMKADMGRVEMDLIHFAKINGISREHLSKNDQLLFDQWFENLPEFKKHLFSHSSLGDVLDAHANELYQTANSGFEELVSNEEAKRIVETTFKCLTKIDESRAVRNRMTLQEITNIINDNAIGIEKVSKTLTVFRRQGNTFIKPFIFDEQSSQGLNPDSVLDITHESLIRNWNKLTDWAQEEHENYSTWLDFNKQLERWVKNDKSSGYLLPIGPLTFFENWFKTSKPNKYWLARYDDREISAEDKIADAAQTIENATKFLRKSANRLFLSRTVLKYGADNIMVGFVILLVLFGCVYFYFDSSAKQNHKVLALIQANGSKIIKSRHVKLDVKSKFIEAQANLNLSEYSKLINSISSDSERVEVQRIMIGDCLLRQDGIDRTKKFNPLLNKLLHDFINTSYKDAQTKKIAPNYFDTYLSNILTVTHAITRINKRHLEIAGQNTQDSIRQLYKIHLNRFEEIFKKNEFNIASRTESIGKILLTVPLLCENDSTQILRFISILNPFTNKSNSNFQKLFPESAKISASWSRNEFNYGGAYYFLTNYFLLVNNFKDATRCIDTLYKYNQNFVTEEPNFNYQKILLLLVNKHTLYSEDGQVFLNYLCQKQVNKKKLPNDLILLNEIVNHDVSDYNSWRINDLNKPNDPFKVYARDLQTQHEFLRDIDLKYLLDGILNSINTKYKSDEAFYLKALAYKNFAFAYNRYSAYDSTKFRYYIIQSLENYRKISTQYLTESIEIVSNSGNPEKIIRSALFKTPDNCNLLNLNSSQGLYDIQDFISIIDKEIGVQKFYNTSADLKTLNNYLLKYYSNFYNLNKKSKINHNSLVNLATSQLPESEFDNNALNMYLSAYYFKRHQNFLANQIESKIDFSKLTDDSKYKNNDELKQNYRALYESFYFSKLLFDTTYKKTFESLGKIPSQMFIRNFLIKASDTLLIRNKANISLVALDTLINTYLPRSQNWGSYLCFVLGKISTNYINNLNFKLIKDRTEKVKYDCLHNYIKGLAASGKYFEAYTEINDHLSSNSQLQLYTAIINAELWRKKDFNPQLITHHWINSIFEDDFGYFILDTDQ